MTTCPLHPDLERPCPKCGIARVRAALAAASKPPRPPESTNTVHAAALARAQAERLAATRQRIDQETQS